MDQEPSRMANTVSSGNTIFPNVEAMLSHRNLSKVANRPVTSVRLASFKTVGWSSTHSQFLGVYINGEERPFALIKRITRITDWVMQATDDLHYRAAAIWEKGLLDHMPLEIDHAILSCAIVQDGYALLMRNISDSLPGVQTKLSEPTFEFILDTIAAFHAAYWESPSLHDPSLYLCSPFNLFSHTSPNKIEPLVPENPSPVVQVILAGWRMLPDLIGSDLANKIITLSNNPQPICTALAKYPQTLVHGDFHLANLGLERGEINRLILLDWARPTFSAPGVDIAFLLGINGHTLPVSRDEAIELYRQNLARRLGNRYDLGWWQPQLELCLLAGFAMTGCFQAFTLHEKKNAAERKKLEEGLAWWCERATAAMKSFQSLQFL
jgi:hypothetical protein